MVYLSLCDVWLLLKGAAELQSRMRGRVLVREQVVTLPVSRSLNRSASPSPLCSHTHERPAPLDRRHVNRLFLAISEARGACQRATSAELALPVVSVAREKNTKAKRLPPLSEPQRREKPPAEVAPALPIVIPSATAPLAPDINGLPLPEELFPLNDAPPFVAYSVSRLREMRKATTAVCETTTRKS